MSKRLSLDLAKVIQDTRTIATAAAVANVEGQIVPVESRSDVLNAIWAAEGLLEALQDLQGRSENQWAAAEREKRWQERLARLEANKKDSDGSES